MDIQRELENLKQDQDKLLQKYGNKFSKAYQRTTALLSLYTQGIIRLENARRESEKTIAEIQAALNVTNTLV